MRRTVQLLQSLLALTISIVVLVGVPTALITQVGWPLPSSWPDLDTLTRSAQTGVSDTFVIGALTVVVWIAWTQLAIAMLVEAVAAVRRHPSRALPVLPGLQPVAARLVAAIMLASVLVQPRASLAGPPLGSTLTTATAPLEAATETSDTTPAHQVTRTVTRQTTMVTTGVRDSWWQLAEHHLGDGLRWREIRDLNVDRRVGTDTVLRADSDHLEPGWQLLVPVDSNAGSSHDTRAEDADARPDRHDSSTDDEVWEVVDGDHFWSIAETVLTTTWERPPTDAEVTPYWRQLVDANRDALLPPHDPDLIHPGQQFTIPNPPTDPAAAPSPAEPTQPRPPDPAPADRDAGSQLPDVPADQEPAEADRPSGSWSSALQGAADEHAEDPERGPSASAGPSHAGPPHAGAPTDGWQAALESGGRSTAEVGLDAAAPSDQDRSGMLLPGVAAAALAAAGILSLLRRRRRAAMQQRPAGYRLPTPAPDTADELGRLEAAAPSIRALNDLVNLLTSIPEGVQPALTTTTNSGHVTLLFDDTAKLPDPPTPWSLHHHDTDGPVGWRANLGTSGPSRSFGLPLLITLGQTGNATVLANLGAIGTLHITGPDEPVRRVLRTMSIELATTRTAGPVDVVVVGDDAFVSVEDLRHVEDLAAELDTAIAEGAHGVVLADRLPRLLVCHHGQHTPTLPEHGVDGLVGIVTADPPPAAGWSLEVDDDHTGRLQLPDGGHVELTLPAVQPEVINTELDRLEHLERPDNLPAADPTDDHAGPATADLPTAVHPAGTATNGHHPTPPPPIEPAWCEVRLLGPVEVVRDGAEVSGLSPLSLQVLLYLATHRDGVTAERLDDAVWAGRIAPPGSQRLRASLTKLRTALGNGPDGQLLLPRRPNTTSHVRLSSNVGSDLDRAMAHLARARDLPDPLAAADEIAAALALVRGEPFEGLPLSWTSEVNQHAIAQLQDAAITAAETYRDAGRYGPAEEMIHRGLRLCDPCEPLYIQWAHLEAARGRRDQIPHLWRQLRARYDTDADETAGWVVTPTPETELAFETLMADE